MGAKIFSSVWERLFQIFFPAGFLTVEYGVVFILGTFLIYAISRLIGKPKGEGWDQLLRKMLLTGILLAVAMFSPVIAGAYISFLLWNGFRFGKSIPNIPPDKKIGIIVLNALGILAFVGATGIFSYFWQFWFANLLLIGFGCGILFLCLKPARNWLTTLQSGLEKRAFKHVRSYALLLLVILGALFSVTGFLRPYTPAPVDYTPSGSMDLKIMNYNIRKGNTPERNSYDSWGERKDNLVRYIDTFNSDFLLVQEAYVFQLRYLTQNLENRSYAYTGAGREDGVVSGEHSAVIFDQDRFTFLTGGSFWLSESPHYPQISWSASDRRICSWGRFEEKSTQDQIVVASVHYDFSTEFRVKASKLINAKMVEISGSVPVILGGDFNMNRTKEGYEFLENYGEKPLNSSFHLLHGYGPSDPFPTFNGFGNFDEISDGIIDFIFISAEITVTGCEVPQDTYDPGDGGSHYYSDHFPVVMSCTV